MLVKNRENKKKSWKSKKIMKMHVRKKIDSKTFLKIWTLYIETRKDGIFRESWNYLMKKVFWNSDFKGERSQGKEQGSST